MPRVPGTLGLSTAVPEDSEGPWVQDPSPVCQQGLGMHSCQGGVLPTTPGLAPLGQATWRGPRPWDRPSDLCSFSFSEEV